MKKIILILLAVVALLVTGPGSGWSAYHHEGEDDSAKFLRLSGEGRIQARSLCPVPQRWIVRERRKITTLGSCQCATTVWI
jgi:hypothetical protein